jgi:hypothetical protein
VARQVAGAYGQAPFQLRQGYDGQVSFWLSDKDWMSLLHSEFGRSWQWFSFGSLGSRSTNKNYEHTTDSKNKKLSPRNGD